MMRCLWLSLFGGSEQEINLFNFKKADASGWISYWHPSFYYFRNKIDFDPAKSSSVLPYSNINQIFYSNQFYFGSKQILRLKIKTTFLRISLRLVSQSFETIQLDNTTAALPLHFHHRLSGSRSWGKFSIFKHSSRKSTLFNVHA